MLITAEEVRKSVGESAKPRARAGVSTRSASVTERRNGSSTPKAPATPATPATPAALKKRAKAKSAGIKLVKATSKTQPIALNSFATEPMESLPQVLLQLSQSGEGVARVLSKLHLAMSGAFDEHGCDDAVQSVIAFAAGKPYFDLADYMGRTWLVEPAEGRAYNARVHKVMRSDHDRCLHDHPWNNGSIVLKGGYWEVLPGAFQEAIELLHEHNPLTGLELTGRLAGTTLLPAKTIKDAQRLNALIQVFTAEKIVAADVRALAEMNVVWRGPLSYTPRLSKDAHRLVIPKDQPAWSVFVMRPKVCEWGFLTPHGWVHNEPYLKALGKDA